MYSACILISTLMSIQVCSASEFAQKGLRGSSDVRASNLQTFIVYSGNQGEGSVQKVDTTVDTAPADTAIYASVEHGYDNVNKELAAVGKIADVASTDVKLFLRFDVTGDVCSEGTKAIDVWNSLVKRMETFSQVHGLGQPVVGIACQKENPQLTCKGINLDPTLLLSMASDPENFPTGLASNRRFEMLKIEGGPDSVGKIDKEVDLSQTVATPTGTFTWDYILAEYGYEPFDKHGKSIFPKSKHPTLALCKADAQACIDRCSAGPVPIRSESGCPAYENQYVVCDVPGLAGAKELIDAGIAQVDTTVEHEIYTLGYGPNMKADCHTTAQGAIAYAFQQVSSSDVLNTKSLALFIGPGE